MTPFPWLCRHHRFEIGPRPLILGIVNVTPDSFSDGGQFFDPSVAVEHGLKLVAEGADLLDVGGESTRPGSDEVPAEEELRRVLTVVRELAKRTTISISVDTKKAAVAEACLDAGAVVVNDVSGLTADSRMPAVCANAKAGVIVMHMRGTPKTMQADPRYDDVVREVGDFFAERLRTLADAGVPPESVCLDPGIGFGKTQPHNFALLANLRDFQRFGRPVCLGVSRKGVIGTVCGRPRDMRMPGSLAVACFAVAAGAAQVLRVHDVAPHRDAAVLWQEMSKSLTPS